MSTITDFIGNPETFMQQNIVIVTTADPATVPDDGLVWVTLANTNLRVANKTGTVWEMYIVKSEVQNGQVRALRAYYCPYENDKSFFITLGNEASFMFTPKMDGCSFGVGSQQGGACRVGHVNFTGLQNDWKAAGEDVARSRMYQAQRSFLSNKLGIGTDRVIDPSVYRGDALINSATTFGVRASSRTWTFKTLRFSKPGAKTYLHLGVHDHVTT